MSQPENFGPEHYRSLFEGSQASLADMAARQAQALARVGRLRSAIVAVLRKNFTELSAQAEANLGGRLSEIDDEILLAYLDAFTAAASRGDQRATLQAMKEAVASLGIPLRGDEPLVWVEQIHQHRQHVQQARRSSETNQTADLSARAGDRAEPPVSIPGADMPSKDEPVRRPRENQPLPVDDYWKWDQATPLGDLFDDVEEKPAGNDVPALWGNELGSMEPEEDRWTPSPVAPTREPRTGPGPAPAVAPEPEETLPVTPGTPAPVVVPLPSVTTQPFAPQAHDVANASGAETQSGAPGADDGGERKPAKRQPRKRATAPGGTTGTTAVPEKTDDAPGVVAPASTGDAVHETVNVDATEDLSSLFDDTPTVGATNTMVDAPMRPELFTPSTPRKRRTARTKASAPIAEIPLVEAAGAQELNDGMRAALMAAAAIPRPVFTRDLIGVAGSLAMVDAWEAECRADVSSSPVRFVAPKSRHRLRGHLVAVEPSVVRPGDWWYQAVQRYRAGRLYELAVLLHRVGDEIVSFVLEDQLAVFRLNTPRGLVGIVVVLDPRPVLGGASSQDLADHLATLLSERLTMIAVLTASAEPGSLENIISHVEELAGRNSWQPTAPVIAARSWEYADDRGTSAVMVLGQG